jgi:shikimate dehydrogenase
MITTPSRTRLAVLGSPISHSLSPTLHAAAYGVLGLDWEYDSIEMRSESLSEFVRSRDDSWRGLSLTMPLKRDVLPLLDSMSELVEHTGSANTVVFDGAQARARVLGYNTDVYGITRAFAEHGVDALESALILGGGATAASAIVALAAIGATRIQVAVRQPERAAQLVDVAGRIGAQITMVTLDDPLDFTPDAVISTLPNGTDVELDFGAEVLLGATLLDVAYHPWPSSLAKRWGGMVISGLEMLIFQALQQVRIFVDGDPETALDRESEILNAMRSSVGL